MRRFEYIDETLNRTPETEEELVELEEALKKFREFDVPILLKEY